MRKSNSHIIGLYGCYCHPYKSWEDLKYHEKKKLTLGQKVKHRCDKRQGVILGNVENTIYPDDLTKEPYKVINKQFYDIKYGELPRDHQIIHVSNAIII
tara:strand:+ start:17970 stop:18266 length:297 start_codon:yes stop_codon:yes gene_type:complete